MTERKLGTLFLSHSSCEPDYSVTESLANALTRIGLDVWWDSDRLEGGKFFAAEIVEAIIRQRFFLFLVSPHSVSSKWCIRELVRATELGKQTIPLIVEEVPEKDLPLHLAGLHNIRLSTGVESALPAILRALGLGLPSAAAPTDPFARDGRLLYAIANQLSYALTFTNKLNMVLLLEKIGLECCETERARTIFAGMRNQENWTSSGGVSKIDYGKVKDCLTQRWEDQQA